MLNMTPHTVRIYDAAGTTVIGEIPPAGPAVRVERSTSRGSPCPS